MSGRWTLKCLQGKCILQHASCATYYSTPWQQYGTYSMVTTVTMAAVVEEVVPVRQGDAKQAVLPRTQVSD